MASYGRRIENRNPAYPSAAPLQVPPLQRRLVGVGRAQYPFPSPPACLDSVLPASPYPTREFGQRFAHTPPASEFDASTPRLLRIPRVNHSLPAFFSLYAKLSL